MILADTSVRVAALRSSRAAEANQLRSLLDRDEICLAVIVRLEILLGAGRRDRARLARLLSSLPVFYPTDRTWTTIESWIEKRGSVGQRFGITNLVIAAIAAERGAAVWSLDADFARLQRLGLVRLHRP